MLLLFLQMKQIKINESTAVLTFHAKCKDTYKHLQTSVFAHITEGLSTYKRIYMRVSTGYQYTEAPTSQKHTTVKKIVLP